MKKCGNSYCIDTTASSKQKEALGEQADKVLSGIAESSPEGSARAHRYSEEMRTEDPKNAAEFLQSMQEAEDTFPIKKIDWDRESGEKVFEGKWPSTEQMHKLQHLPKIASNGSNAGDSRWKAAPRAHAKEWSFENSDLNKAKEALRGARVQLVASLTNIPEQLGQMKKDIMDTFNGLTPPMGTPGPEPEVTQR